MPRKFAVEKTFKMGTSKKTEGENHHKANQGFPDSISLSYFLPHYVRRKRKFTPSIFFGRNVVFSTLVLIVGIQYGTAQNKTETEKKFIVVLDAGHGGHDTGAIHTDGYYEKEINLLVAKYTKIYLEKFAPAIKCVLTRNDDTFLPLKRRSLYAKYLHADLFVSIHCNHNPNRSAEGMEIYIQNTSKKEAQPNLRKAVRFGLILDRVIEDKLNYKSRGVLRENFQVLRESISHTPSVLVELGFFSNANESDYLISKKGIKGLSLTLTKSIIEYFEHI
ncbi:MULTISPECIES: N-acetylmuramoyl-L-alanine amidase [Flavobacteriaceae]|uniref:N-acetylmuramoyl-L-alanine amidase family protein n=1 Tax=Flavobacteriaceae TaxID=49546 RepID=UPI0014917B05|nr:MULTISPECIES: N-acetylmuramoyl-L-alanine amidase [Allomuricauda]MDC6367195.1 N-acetylmuramoyl-L-alanine amidase [Muricauda sp. AC10]